jgi:hypothetical protein
MSNYLPHYTKKLEILERKQETLRRLIAQGAKADRLIAQAIEVRDARVRVLCAKRAKIVPSERNQDHHDRLTDKIGELQAVTPETILAEFRSA